MAVSVEGVDYRSYHPGDEEIIIPFMRECGYDPDDRFWHWINRKCPHGETIVELATLHERVAGHYSVLPRWLWVDGTTVKAGLAIHAVVHPQFRGLAILQELIRRVVQRCRQANIPFIYGFPNDNIWLVYVKLFRWQPIGNIVGMELPVHRLEAASENTLGISFHTRLVFGEQYERFRHSDVLRGVTHVVKDRAYLNWRYANHPKVRYQLLEAQTEKDGLAGYLVLKLYEKQGMRYGHLVDLGLKPTSLALLPQLVSRAISELHDQGVDVASCWIQEGTPFFEAIWNLGFRVSGFSTHAGYRLIDPNFGESALRLERWHIVMGDSDAF